MREPTRQDDERLLAMLRMRCAKVPLPQIAGMHKTTKNNVATRTHAVRAAELKQGWDKPSDITRGYW